jgi:hypothetical protein
VFSIYFLQYKSRNAKKLEFEKSAEGLLESLWEPLLENDTPSYAGISNLVRLLHLSKGSQIVSRQRYESNTMPRW